jgi:DNA-binding transcriptional LysR family regulator
LRTSDGPLKLNVLGRFDADSSNILTDWALAGHGIANKPRFEVAKHLGSGALVEVLPQTPPMPTSFLCLYPHRKLQDPKVRLFIDYVAEALKPQLRAMS